jgi:hypothetical protein
MTDRTEYHADIRAVRAAVEALDRAVRAVRCPADAVEGVDDDTTIAIALANAATMRALVVDLPGAWQLIGVEPFAPSLPTAIPGRAIPGRCVPG